MVLLLCLSAARAQESDSFRITWECDKPYEITGFQLAPCDGLLVPHAQADEAIKLKLVDFPALQQEIAFVRRQAAIDLNEVEAELKIERDKNEDLTKLLDKNLTPPEVPFYDTFWFGASVGAAVATIILVSIWASAD